VSGYLEMAVNLNHMISALMAKLHEM
jgi:hypothetical protein